MQRLAILKTSLFFTAAVFLSGIMTSCVKDDFDADPDLVDPEVKERKLNTGFTDDVIDIKAETWSIPYVKGGTTGELLKDSNGEPFKVEGNDSTVLDQGWLSMMRTTDNKLKMTLKENFSDSPRHFIIGIISDNTKDEFAIIQSRGEAYELVDKKITEVPDSRKVYKSNEGCTTITFVNDTDKPKQVVTSEVFKDVKYSSEFKSQDYGAFEWIKGQDSLIFMDELLHEGSIYWTKQVPYVSGTTYENYIKPDGSKEELTLRPFDTKVVSGEMTYIERTCNYTFTIRNKTSGNRFVVSGTWQQKVPIISHTILNDPK